jgi:hypothetical protein
MADTVEIGYPSSREVCVVCWECGQALKVAYDSTTDTISADPCEKCMCDEFNRGSKEGHAWLQ